MISYNLAPVPIWVLRDNAGVPLVNGKMYTYRDTNRSEFKPVYEDIGGTFPYIQPIIFNAAGFQGPFYWASDENYYIEIYDENDQLVKTIQNYNSPSSTGPAPPITTEVNFTNYIYDSQFTYTTVDYDTLGAYAPFGVSNWVFRKNNTSAVDSLKSIQPSPGATTPPDNPNYFIRYECTVAGAGEIFKSIEYSFTGVRSFQNTEITIAFWARSNIGVLPLEVVLIQEFGEGGGASAPVTTPVTTVNLDGTWAQYQASIVVPSITGKNIDGPTNALYLVIGYPKDVICQIDITNVQWNLGSKKLPFEYLTPTNNATLQIPNFDPRATFFTSPGTDKYGHIAWYNKGSFFFTSTFPEVSLVNSEEILPWGIATGPYPEWFAGPAFRPDRPCVVIFSFYLLYTSDDSNGTNLYFRVRLNGTGDLTRQDQTFDNIGSLSDSASVIMNFNGSTDYIELIGHCQTNGKMSGPFISMQILS